MCKQHLDLLAEMARPLIFRRLGNGSSNITGILVQISGDLAEGHLRTAPRLQLADLDASGNWTV